MKIEEGDVFSSVKWGEYKVIKYSNSRNIEIRFLSTDTVVSGVTSASVLAGSIKDRFRPIIFGVGYIGNSVATEKGKIKPSYTCWSHMLERCYNHPTQEKQPSYKGCTVCDEWLCFEIFESWYTQYFKAGFELDKDLYYKGNKTYCPDKCLFVPQELNSLLTGHHPDRVLPKGVTWRGKNNNYQVRVSESGSTKQVGTFDTKEEAENAYNTEKQGIIYRTVNHYYEKGDITLGLKNKIISNYIIKPFTKEEKQQ